MKVKELTQIFQPMNAPWNRPEYAEKIPMTDAEADLLFKLQYGDMTLVDDITEENAVQYLTAIGKMFYYSWDRLANIYILDYDPVSNYERNEEETVTHSSTRTPNITESFTEQDRTETTETQIYGYNSTDPSDSDKNITTYGGGNKREETGTEEEEGETTRKVRSWGDIGVQSAQSVIEQERKLWEDFNVILNNIFEDVKKVLTIPIWV